MKNMYSPCMRHLILCSCHEMIINFQLNLGKRCKDLSKVQLYCAGISLVKLTVFSHPRLQKVISFTTKPCSTRPTYLEARTISYTKKQNNPNPPRMQCDEKGSWCFFLLGFQRLEVVTMVGNGHKRTLMLFAKIKM